MKVIKTGENAVCVKIYYRDIEISIAADDSCGAMVDMGRVSIVLFQDNIYVTKKILNIADNEIYGVEGKDLNNIFKAIDLFLDR